MKDIVICNHTGCFNRGCEAIIKSTAELFENKGIHSILAEHRYYEDTKFGYNEFAEVIEYSEFSNHPIRRTIGLIQDKMLHNEYRSAYWRQKDIWKKLNGNVAFNVGGDTYCYGRHVPSLTLNKYCSENGVPSIFWGCSIDEQSIKTREINEDLNRYSYIITREELTYKQLLRAGFSDKKVLLGADPAFCLQPTETELPEIMKKRECICINLSPLVMSLGHSNAIVEGNYIRLIDYILKETNYGIVLIPHVYYSDDLEREDLRTLNSIKSHYQDNNRVYLISRFYTAKELKFIISKCRFAIVARTHASIAAYSSSVPTIVIGYSIKSEGIAYDLFGTTEGYVLPVQSLTKQGELRSAFVELMEKEKKIKDLLCAKKNEMLARINSSIDSIYRLF